jgi:hypothetical protein
VRSRGRRGINVADLFDTDFCIIQLAFADSPDLAISN